MAVSIDTVYQRVLAIANKEQRGYITPQEFNLLANQAQMEIFEQYFYDTNQLKRFPGNSTEYSDMLSNMSENIAIFERSATPNVTAGAFTLSPVPYRVGSLFYNNGTDYIEVERVSNKKIRLLNQTPIVAPSVIRPVYVQTSATTIQMYPTSGLGNVTVNYIAKPATVKWGYVIVDAGNNTKQPLYDSSASATTDFELHTSEEPKLVISILALAGIVIKQPDLYQVAEREETKTTQQEKQ